MFVWWWGGGRRAGRSDEEDGISSSRRQRAVGKQGSFVDRSTTLPNQPVHTNKELTLRWMGNPGSLETAFAALLLPGEGTEPDVKC